MANLPCIYARLKPTQCENGWRIVCYKGQANTCSSGCTEDCPLFTPKKLSRESFPVSVANIPNLYRWNGTDLVSLGDVALVAGEYDDETGEWAAFEYDQYGNPTQTPVVIDEILLSSDVSFSGGGGNPGGGSLEAHTHIPNDITGGTAGWFLRSNGTRGVWENVAIPSAISQANIESRTNTTAGLITGERLTQGLIARHVPNIMRGTTDTAAATAIKAVTLAAPYNTVTDPVAGDMIAVTFSVANTTAALATLGLAISLNGGESKQVRVSGALPTAAASTGAAHVVAGGTMLYYFDGTFWQQLGSGIITNTNTTYTAATSAYVHNANSSKDYSDCDQCDWVCRSSQCHCKRYNWYNLFER